MDNGLFRMGILNVKADSSKLVNYGTLSEAPHLFLLSLELLGSLLGSLCVLTDRTFLNVSILAKNDDDIQDIKSDVNKAHLEVDIPPHYNAVKQHKNARE